MDGIDTQFCLKWPQRNCSDQIKMKDSVLRKHPIKWYIKE